MERARGGFNVSRLLPLVSTPSEYSYPAWLGISIVFTVAFTEFTSFTCEFLHNGLSVNPFCAKTAKAVDVSLNVIPAPAATAAEADKPYFNSCTSVAEALAAPASKLAASVTLKPSFLNAFKAVEAISPLLLVLVHLRPLSLEPLLIHH